MRVGVIGGGQLARMMIPPAINLGIDLHVLAESHDASARVAATVVGDYRDVDVVREFARSVDVVTFDHEHVPMSVLTTLIDDGVVVRPGPHALVFAQDKGLMREKLSVIDAPIPRWALVETAEAVVDFLAEGRASEIVAKTPRGGYDGKGVRVISHPAEIEDWLGTGPVLLEEKVEFRRELAQLVARRPTDEIRSWDVVETVQRNGVCAEVIAPAPGSETLSSQAREIAEKIAEGLDVVGVVAVEMFETKQGDLLVNELAMRPHNSGHVFTELSLTSQFEQHLRAVLDLPLGSVELRNSAGVMVNVFGGVKTAALSTLFQTFPDIKVHDYGKSPRAGRKAGHVVALSDTRSIALERAREAAALATLAIS